MSDNRNAMGRGRGSNARGPQRSAASPTSDGGYPVFPQGGPPQQQRQPQNFSGAQQPPPFGGMPAPPNGGGGGYGGGPQQQQQHGMHNHGGHANPMYTPATGAPNTNNGMGAGDGYDSGNNNQQQQQRGYGGGGHMQPQAQLPGGRQQRGYDGQGGHQHHSHHHHQQGGLGHAGGGSDNFMGGGGGPGQGMMPLPPQQQQHFNPQQPGSPHDGGGFGSGGAGGMMNNAGRGGYPPHQHHQQQQMGGMGGGPRQGLQGRNNNNNNNGYPSPNDAPPMGMQPRHPHQQQQQQQQQQPPQPAFAPGVAPGFGPGSGYQPSVPVQPPLQDGPEGSEDVGAQGGQRTTTATRRNQPYARPVESPDPEGTSTPQAAASPPKVMGRGGAARGGSGNRRGGGLTPSSPAGEGADGDSGFPDAPPQRSMVGARGRGGGPPPPGYAAGGGSNPNMSGPNTPHFDGIQGGGAAAAYLGGGSGGQMSQQRSPAGLETTYGHPGMPGRGGGPAPQQMQQLQGGGNMMMPGRGNNNGLSGSGGGGGFGGPPPMMQQGQGGGMMMGSGGGMPPQQQPQGFSARHGGRGGGGGMQLQHPGGMGGGMGSDLSGSPLYAGGGSGMGGASLRIGGQQTGGADFGGSPMLHHNTGGRSGSTADVAGPRLRLGGDFGGMPPNAGQPMAGLGMGRGGGGMGRGGGGGQYHDATDGNMSNSGFATPSPHMPQQQQQQRFSPNTYPPPQGQGQYNNNQHGHGNNTTNFQQPSPAYVPPHPGRVSSGPHDDNFSQPGGGGGGDLRGMPVHIGLPAANLSHHQHHQNHQHDQAPPVRVGPVPTPDVSVGLRGGTASQPPQPAMVGPYTPSGPYPQQQQGGGGGRGRGGGGGGGMPQQPQQPRFNNNGPRGPGTNSASPPGAEMQNFTGVTPTAAAVGGGTVSVVVGKHAGGAVQRGSVIDATQAPVVRDADEATLSSPGSAIILPAEFSWMRDIQQASAAAMLFSQGAVRAQQCPRSGFLHMLYLLADRTVEITDPDAIRNVILEVAQEEAHPHGIDTESEWRAVLPSARRFGFFHVEDLRAVAKAKNVAITASSSTNSASAGGATAADDSAAPGGLEASFSSSTHESSGAGGALLANPHRAGMRTMLVDGDLFLANVLRALHRQDAKWFLVSETPDMLCDICSVAAMTLFTDNGVDPRFIFSGVPGAECDTDAVQTTATLLKQQDAAWTAIRDAWEDTIQAARRRVLAGDSADGDTTTNANNNGNSGSQQQPGATLRSLTQTEDSPRRTLRAVASVSSLCSFLNEDPLDGPLRSGFASRTELHAPITDAIRETVMCHLNSNLGFEVIRAPQLAWAQAAAIIATAKSAADADGQKMAPPPLYGPPEALLVDGIDSVILAIDGDAGRCLTLSKSEVLDAIYVRDSASVRRAPKAEGGSQAATDVSGGIATARSSITSAAKMELGADVGSASSESDFGDEDDQSAGAATGGGASSKRGDASSSHPASPVGAAAAAAAVQPPEVTNSIAATLTVAEKTAALVDFGLLTTTHGQLAAYGVKATHGLSGAGHGADFIRAFNYRTLVPFGAKPEEFVGLTTNATTNGRPEDANQPEDCDAALQQWYDSDESKAVSGVGRYRIDRLIAMIVDTTTPTAALPSQAAPRLARGNSDNSLLSYSQGPAAAASNAGTPGAAIGGSGADALALRALRKAKWRILRGRALLRHCPVMAPGFVPATVEDGNTDPDVASLSRVLASAASGGKAATLDDLRIPMNLKDVCGAQVPAIMQYAHCIGALRASTLTMFAHLYDKTERPHVDSYLIRRCLTKCTTVLRALAFEELVGAMASSCPDVETHVGDGLTPTSWLAPTRGRRARFSRADLDDWPLSRFDEMAAHANPADLPIDLHSVLYLSTKGVSPRPDRDAPPAIQASSLYHTRRQFVAAVHLKLLDFLGYFVHPDPIECELGMYGKALARFPSSLNIMIDTYGQPNPINHAVTRQVTRSYAQQVILLIELLRTESLSSKEVVYVTSANWDSTRRLHGASSAGVVMAAETEPNATLPTKPDRAAVLLGSRVSCLCPIKVHGPWTGFLDRELAGFSSITHHLQHALRRVADVLAASMLVSGRYTGPLEDLAEAGAEMPMSAAPTAAAGCLMRFILESPDDFGVGLTNPSDRLSYIASVFPCFIVESIRREAVLSPTAAKAPAAAGGTNPLSADDDGAGSSVGSSAATSRHTASCMEGCPQDADIDYRNARVIQHMDGVLGEVFGFWDIAYHVVGSLKDLAIEESEREDGEHVRGIPDDLLLTFRQTNDIMHAKRQLFGIKPEADDDDDADVDPTAVDVGVPLPN